MKNLVALLCLISALVGSGFSGQCKSCDCDVPSNCKETVVNCTTDRCMTSSLWRFNEEHGNMVKRIQRGCEAFMWCGINLSDDYGPNIVRLTHRCCPGPLCNTDGYAYKDLEPLEKILMDNYAMWHPRNRKNNLFIGRK
ncbi:uncharacterized protein ACNLHF_003099 [Anomaloglossus baeobatrachus]